MNYIDIIILVLVIWSAYRGFKKGFIMMAAALAALILGIWGAIKFSHLTTDILTNSLELSTPYLRLISFTITFLAIVIAITITAYIISRLLDLIALGLINRLAGLLFGTVKMVLILSVMFVILNAFDTSYEFLPHDDIQKSRYYNKISEIAPQLFPSLNFSEIAKEIEDIFREK